MIQQVLDIKLWPFVPVQHFQDEVFCSRRNVHVVGELDLVRQLSHMAQLQFGLGRLRS